MSSAHQSRDQTKICVACGRTFAWRKKWARDWDAVRYCSDACRKRGVCAVDRALEDAILHLLAQPESGATICPSEAARLVQIHRNSVPQQTPKEGDDTWRALMEPARRAARRLAARNEIVITQNGMPVDPSAFRGPIRLRFP